MILLIKMNSNTNNLNKVESTMIEEQLNKELLTYYYTTSDNTCLEYFVGYEVATLLGYKNTAHTIITNVSTSNQLQFRDYKGVKEPYLDPRTILISRDGAIEILLKTRKSISADVLQILQKNNIKIPTKKSILKETEKIQVNYTENNQELDFEDEEENEKNTELTTYSYISNHICFEYFVGYQIAVLLGYKNITQVIQNISKSNQLLFSDYPGPKIPYLDPRTILISRDGAIEILIKTRKRISADVLHLLKKFHIETTNMKCLTKEQQTLSAITNVLKTEKYEDQYKIGSYYLDLYFTEYKIVVECDENGHADRKPYKERERMDYVNKELDIDDSNWIRYNPDEKDFDISKMIGRIYTKMKEIKFINESKIVVIPIKKKQIRKKEDDDIRQCICCKIDKEKTTNFSRHGTGYLSYCNECSSMYVSQEKPVNQYNLDGKFICKYPSIKAAGLALNIIPGQISQVCRGKASTAGKFMWRFVDVKVKKEIDEEEIEFIIEEDDTEDEEDDVKEDDIEEEEDDVKDDVEEDDDVKDDVKDDVEEDDNIVAMNNSVIKMVAKYEKNGTFIKTYKSGHEAAIDMKVTPSSIYGAIRNNFVCKGYVWKYVDNGKVIEKVEEVTEFRRYMKQVDVYKDGELYKSFLSITAASKGMNVNVSMCRKFLSNVKKDPSNYEWKFR